MALVYVGAAALGRRSASWVVLLAGLPVAFFVPSTLGINPSVILLAAAFFLVVGRSVEDRARPAASRCRPPGCSSSARCLWRP